MLSNPLRRKTFLFCGNHDAVEFVMLPPRSGWNMRLTTHMSMIMIMAKTLLIPPHNLKIQIEGNI